MFFEPKDFQAYEFDNECPCGECLAKFMNELFKKKLKKCTRVYGYDHENAAGSNWSTIYERACDTHTGVVVAVEVIDK